MKKLLFYPAVLLCVFLFYWAIWAVTNLKMHNFEGRCRMCHINPPEKGGTTGDLSLVDSIDMACDKCHTVDRQKSHPIKIKPAAENLLTAHLDKNGLINCITCHDVHKEDKTSNKLELTGLLWSHLRGRAFCALCHSSETKETKWQHQTAIPYAHSYGKVYLKYAEKQTQAIFYKE